ncbi:MAG: GYD domain-containing protein [Candidatus Omnitrophota bacterium]
MATFLMLGRYSSEAIKGISKDRTGKVMNIVEKSSGKIKSMMALLGRYDLAFIVDFPGTKEALKASVDIAKITGIGFMTMPALTVDEFDKAIG